MFASATDCRIVRLQKGFVPPAIVQVSRISGFIIFDTPSRPGWLWAASLHVIRDLLGHSPVSVTERYAHLSPDEGRNAVQRLWQF
jgi:integrase/recombinase XerD